MLKGIQISPIYIKRLPFKETFGKKITLRTNCRCLYLTSLLKKKSEESDVERLKREAPFFFKAIKVKGAEPKVLNHKTEHKSHTPLIFRPILVKKEELEDYISHFGHKVQPTLKKENVYIVQPRFKWGREKTHSKFVHHRLAEAGSLINSIHMWAVHTVCIEPIQEVNPRCYFGTGKVLELSEKIRDAINNDGVTMVFLNTERLTLRQVRELESVWGCKVFDRYRVVLELFKERAKTKQSSVQVLLAEIQYMRTHLVADSQDHDRQRGGGQSMSGSGETYREKFKRVLEEKEKYAKKALQSLKTHKSLIKLGRKKKHVPEVAMVGYTNAGKTALAKALSHSKSLQAEDKLFATLDTTAHRGKLPSGLNLVFIDTVGFISDLPHELVESFSATLQDVKDADLLIHVTDCSHPEFELQKQTVENILEKLEISEELLRSKITVLNKVDLRSDLASVGDADTIAISATEGIGIEELRIAIEKKVLKSTGRGNFTINIDLYGQELSWLYRNGTVIDTSPCDNGSLDVVAILDDASKNKFEKQFNVKLVRS